MSTDERSIIIISSQCLEPGGVFCITKKVKSSNTVLIKGRVLNPDNSPSIGACVEVIELEIKEITLGYVFTNNKGDFGFTINYKPNVDYKLNIYSPLPISIL